MFSFLFSFALMADPVISFHAECDSGTRGCVEMETPEGKFHLSEQPALTLSAKDFEQATSIPGHENVSMLMTPEAATKFSELTTATVGKRLAFIVNGEVLTAPVVNEAVAGSEFQLNGNVARKLPWIHKLQPEANNPKKSRNLILIFVIGGVSVLVGAILWATRPK